MWQLMPPISPRYETPETISVGLTTTGFCCCARYLMRLGIKATSNGTAASKVAMSSQVFSGLSSIGRLPNRESDDARRWHAAGNGSTEPSLIRRTILRFLRRRAHDLDVLPRPRRGAVETSMFSDPSNVALSSHIPHHYRVS